MGFSGVLITNIVLVLIRDDVFKHLDQVGSGQVRSTGRGRDGYQQYLSSASDSFVTYYEADLCRDQKSRSRILKVPRQIQFLESKVSKVQRQIQFLESKVSKVPRQIQFLESRSPRSHGKFNFQNPRFPRSHSKYTLQGPQSPRSHDKNALQDQQSPRSHDKNALQDPQSLGSHDKCEFQDPQSPRSHDKYTLQSSGSTVLKVPRQEYISGSKVFRVPQQELKQTNILMSRLTSKYSANGCPATLKGAEPMQTCGGFIVYQHRQGELQHKLKMIIISISPSLA